MKVWYMTTGEAGFRTQARGLASALGPEPRELVVGLRAPWGLLPGAWAAPFALSALTPDSDRPAPPWPDVLVTCGRRATALSIAIRRASRGATLTVHVQNPLTAPSAFDLIAPMVHDQVSGPNVLNVATALHDLTPERLTEAAEVWRERLAEPGRPLIGVMLGGSSRRQPFEAAEATALATALRALMRQTGARLAATPSRRTPPAARAAFAEAFAGQDDAFVWDMQGDNPYRGILALSDRLVVTGDSVSMVSEALSTPHPVEVVGLGGGRRHVAFLEGLIADGLVRPFAGDPQAGPSRTPVNATEVVAQAVRGLLQARTTVSG